MPQKRKTWELGFERFFKDAPKGEESKFIPFPDWEIHWGKEIYTLEFDTLERYERAKAMLEFCTEYEKESFELFYKWFKQNKGKED